MIVLIGIVICTLNCAGWTKGDKTLLTINGVLMTVDMLQTEDIFRHEEYYEINPIINTGVNHFGTGFIPFYFAGSFGLQYLVADALPNIYRKMFLTGSAAMSAALVIHNNSIGLEVGF